MRIVAVFAVTFAALGLVPGNQSSAPRAEGTVFGRITVDVDGKSQAVPWVAVTALGDGGSGALGLRAGADGEYRVQAPAGHYAFWFFAYGFTPAVLDNLDVAAGTELKRDVVLKSTTPAVTMPPRQMNDAVIEASTDPTAGLLGPFVLYGPRQAPQMSQTLSSDGTAIVIETMLLPSGRPTPVPSGTYTLWANARGFSRSTARTLPDVAAVQDVVVRPGATTRVNVPAVISPVPDVRVRIDTTAGPIDIVVQPSAAPITSANFLKYVDGGFYTSGRFHRATRDGNYAVALPNRPLLECIQAGINPDRKSDGFPPIPLEPTNVTGLTHVVGTVAMARGAHSDTATSDFFILLNDQPSLDLGGRRFDDWQGSAAFGRVVAGMDVVRKIQQLPTTGQSLTPPVTIRSATRVRP